MLRSTTAAVLTTATLLLVTACGGSDSTSNDTTTTSAAASGTVPALTGDPTDTTKEAVISAGGADAPTTLLTADVVEGTGDTATAASTVDVRYTGALYSDGTVFDASWKAGDAPISFPLSQVVPGFAQGIEGMKVGGRREIVIPPDLGYGAQTQGPIPGGSTLVFVVDLVSIS